MKIQPNVLAVAVTLIFVSFARASVDPCNKGNYCDEGIVVPNPNDCHMYFVCNNGQWYRLNCAVGSKFDKDLLQCVSEENAVCMEQCTSFTGTTVLTTTSAAGLCDDDNKTATCVQDRRYPDRSSCIHYYLCSNQRFIRLQCPMFLVFDIDIADCIVPNSSFNCEYRCRTQEPTAVQKTTELSSRTSTTTITSSTSTATPNLLNIQPGRASVDPCNKGNYCDQDSVVPDPNDCRQYFTCEIGRWAFQNCSVGSKFDKVRLECMFEEDADCLEPCPPFTGTTLLTTTLVPGVCNDDNNTAACINGLQYADRSSCEHFYICDNGYLIRQPCPTNQVFDIDIGDCIIPNSSFNCEYRCRTPAPTTIETTTGPRIDPCNKPSFCSPTGELVPDPDDCQNYYACNFDFRWRLQSCQSGLLFDNRTLTCRSDQVSCQEACPPVTGTTTTLSPGACDGDNITEPCTNGQVIPDRSDCHHFYQCVSGVFQRKQCFPSVLVFDIDLLVCIQPTPTFDCSYRCKTPAPTTAGFHSSQSQTSEYTSQMKATGSETVSHTPEITTRTWTTASTITSLTSTTSLNLPNIQPDPTIAIISNGTFQTSSAVSDPSCFDEYISEFRKSLKNTLQRAAASDQVCVANTNSMTFKEGCATVVISDNQGSLRFDYQVIPEETNTVRDIELCAADVQTFIGDFSNWRQPIIADITNCPDVVFTPEKFDVVSMKWQCS